MDSASTHDLVSPRCGGLGHRRRLWQRCHIHESGFNFAPARGPTIVPEPTTPSESIEPPAPAGGRVIDIFVVPRVDTSIANVPIKDIIFDTFGRSVARFVPLDQATEEFILGLRDAIAPIYQPAYGGPDDLPWLSDDNLIIGYVSGDDAYAYPIDVLNLHELVNDEIDGVPVLISYCLLCASGVVYNRELEAGPFHFLKIV